MTSPCDSLPSPLVSNTFTVSLLSPNGRHLPAVGTVQGDRQWPLKTVEIPSAHVSPQSTATEAIPNCIKTSQSITKGRCQYVSYPTDSLTTAKLRLCSSLIPERTAIMMGVWVGQDFCKSNGDQIEREIPCGVRQGSLLGRMAYWLDPGPSRYATGFVSGRK